MALKQTPPTFTAVTTGSNEYSIQLNDANLESTAWRSSRYDGSQTITTTLNKYNDSDKTFGKTTATQKYSRNIYIGNGIIGMDGAASEDASLVSFPNFSYVSTRNFITVNNDNTVTTTGLESQKLTNDQKIGFYRSFYEDFPILSDCQVILNDESVRSGLKDRYNIHFNGGTLQKLLHIQSGPRGGAGQSYISYITASVKESVTIYTAASNPAGFNTPHGTRGGLYLAGLAGSGGTLADSTSTHTGSLFNQEIYQNWFTGSLEATVTTAGVKPGSQYETKVFSLEGLYEFYNNFFNYQTNSSYKGDKRMFATFVEKHTPSELEIGFNKQPIYTFRSGSYVSNGIATNTLTELSTVELSEVNFGVTALAFAQIGLLASPINQLSFNYTTTASLGFVNGATIPGQPASLAEGGVVFSKTEDSTPSLLLPLVKEKELPDGVGRKSFVIIPENLHPHIKKNLTHFLAKAGISLDLDTIPALDTTFEKIR